MMSVSMRALLLLGLLFPAVFSQDPLCTSSTAGTPSCNFDRSTCGLDNLYTAAMGTSTKATWRRAGGRAGPGPLAHDWQPGHSYNWRNGSYLYLDHDNTVGTTGSVAGQISENVGAMCVELHAATTGHGPQTLNVYLEGRFTSLRTLVYTSEVNSNGAWKTVPIPSLCMVGDSRIIFEGVIQTANGTIALDYIKMTRSNKDCTKTTPTLEASTSKSPASPPPKTTTTPLVSTISETPALSSKTSTTTETPTIPPTTSSKQKTSQISESSPPPKTSPTSTTPETPSPTITTELPKTTTGKSTTEPDPCSDDYCGPNSLRCGYDLTIWPEPLCLCKAGYSGPRCEHHQLCYPHNPCLNNGTCRVGPGAVTFTCSCTEGFSGNSCGVDERSTPPPKQSPCGNTWCFNGGTCQVTGHSKRCQCPSGFTGPKCQYILGNPECHNLVLDLQITPPVVAPPITAKLSATCTLTHLSKPVPPHCAASLKSDLLGITSMFLRRQRTGKKFVEPVSKITLFGNATADIQQKILHVEGRIGRLDSTNSPVATLQSTWSGPRDTQAGQYSCSVVAIKKTGHPIMFQVKKAIRATSPTRQEIRNYIIGLRDRIKALSNNRRN